MKKKITIALSILFMIIIVGVVKIVVENSSSDCEAFNSEGAKIGIDDITYVCTGMQVPIEPDESVIEYVEIPVEGNSNITAFAMISDNGEDYLVCRIDEEWYKFIAE